MINLALDAADPNSFAGVHRHSWPVKITATGIEGGLDPKVFVYHQATGRQQVDGFECVASINQMVDLPADAPVTKTPFYRRDVLEYMCRSAVEAQELWLKVLDDVTDLVANYQASQILINSDTASI